MLNLEYLKNLNEKQKEAVLSLDGPLLIVAGAGSGKTKVLTTRIANIIKEKKDGRYEPHREELSDYHFLYSSSVINSSSYICFTISSDNQVVC